MNYLSFALFQRTFERKCLLRQKRSVDNKCNKSKAEMLIFHLHVYLCQAFKFISSIPERSNSVYVKGVFSLTNSCNPFFLRCNLSFLVSLSAVIRQAFLFVTRLLLTVEFVERSGRSTWELRWELLVLQLLLNSVVFILTGRHWKQELTNQSDKMNKT